MMRPANRLSCAIFCRRRCWNSRKPVRCPRPSVWVWRIGCGASSLKKTLPPLAIGRLLAVPGTRRLTCHGRLAGLAFSLAVRDALLSGFQQQSADWKQQVRDFFLEELQATVGAPATASRSAARLLARAETLLIDNFAAGGTDNAVAQKLDELTRILKTEGISSSLLAQLEPLRERLPTNLKRLITARLAPRTAAPDRPPQPVEPPANLARIPAGKFWMGDPSGQVYPDERPPHEVYVSEFFLEKTPVTWALWRQVCDWARDHGYRFGGTGAGQVDDHPVQHVDWHDAVLWCNARSQMEGLEPCYFTARDHAVLVQSGAVDLAADCVRWQANGYRLPTEAEWEKAARGGREG
jgi:formylglycine-generating enzyme required for sulfatase activity